jgi:hypothetical protein
MDIQNALISSGITSGLYILYKTIQHYRIHSSCNQNNQLVIEVVDIEKPIEKPDKIEEKT